MPPERRSGTDRRGQAHASIAVDIIVAGLLRPIVEGRDFMRAIDYLATRDLRSDAEDRAYRSLRGLQHLFERVSGRAAT